MSQNTFRLVAEHLTRALEPLRTAVEDEESFRSFIFRFGWPIESLPKFWSDLAKDIGDAIADIVALGDDPLPGAGG